MHRYGKRAPGTAIGIIFAAAALLFALAGCGGGSSSSSAPSDLASLVPADAPLYLEGTLKPDTEQKAAIDSIAARFPGGQDIQQKIYAALDQGLRDQNDTGAPPLSFEKDISPWLGDRAGLYLENFNDSSSGAAVVEVTDEAAAQAAVDKLAAADTKPEHPAEEQGVKYSVDTGGDAVAVFDNRLVAGNEDSVKKSIDLAKGDGDDLGAESDYTDSVDRVDGGGALAYMYLDLDRTFDLAKASGATASGTSPDQVRSLLEAGSLDTSKPISLSVTATGDTATAEASVPVNNSSNGAAADELVKVPADAAVAVGAGDLGQRFGQGFTAALQANGADQGRTAEEVQQQLDFLGGVVGVPIDQLGDLLGNGAFFVSGTNVNNVNAGVIAQVKDPSKMSEVLSSAQGLLQNAGRVTKLAVPGAETAFTLTTPQLPVPVEVAYDGQTLVLGAGTGAAAALLSPPQTLGDSSALTALDQPLAGAKPTAFVDMPKLIALLQGTGAAKGPGFQQALPYLTPIGQIATGTGGVSDGYLDTRAALNFSSGSSQTSP